MEVKATIQDDLSAFNETFARYVELTGKSGRVALFKREENIRILNNLSLHKQYKAIAPAKGEVLAKVKEFGYRIRTGSKAVEAADRIMGGQKHVLGTAVGWTKTGGAFGKGVSGKIRIAHVSEAGNRVTKKGMPVGFEAAWKSLGKGKDLKKSGEVWLSRRQVAVAVETAFREKGRFSLAAAFVNRDYKKSDLSKTVEDGRAFRFVRTNPKAEVTKQGSLAGSTSGKEGYFFTIISNMPGAATVHPEFVRTAIREDTQDMINYLAKKTKENARKASKSAARSTRSVLS